MLDIRSSANQIFDVLISPSGPDMNGLSENVPSPVQGTPSDKSIETGWLLS